MPIACLGDNQSIVILSCNDKDDAINDKPLFGFGVPAFNPFVGGTTATTSSATLNRNSGKKEDGNPIAPFFTGAASTTAATIGTPAPPTPPSPPTAAPAANILSIQSRQRLGAILASSLIVILASTTTDFDELSMLIRKEGIWDGYLATSASNFGDAVLPTSASDVVSVALGETIGGIVGASVVSCVDILFGRGNNKQEQEQQQYKTPEREQFELMQVPIATKAIADSDYFLARSASRSLFQYIGVPSTISNLGSSVFALIPSQLVKITYQRQQVVLQRENQIMDELLMQQQRQIAQKTRLSFLDQIIQTFVIDNDQLRLKRNATTSTSRTNASTKQPTTNLQQATTTKFEIDSIDIIADMVRWLEYDILINDYLNVQKGATTMPVVMDGAMFGCISGISSLLYADILYGVFRLGPNYRQLEIRTRTQRNWITLYLSNGLSSAAIFGVYEGTKKYASRWLQGILAGGFDGCVGSQDFDACLQTYIDTNAPGPSLEAQLRALATNFAMVGQRLHDIYADAGSFDQVMVQLRMLIDIYAENNLYNSVY
eukprot:CAMPEP_0119550334 /NCGR_PEP_ID=MMETSP1352-20130426/3863_1 /TAXON_ID=265584 /ORGANISM="Stauroneis constricta, Strain CCMP1120" /LENGTH=545 /DNA_ID=CAMNT_0007596143 /DNA_START=200 /DNA_END=1835 /DNA_ORIENTATION=+